METKIKVNDLVQVTDWGHMYDTNRLWFEEHKNEIPIDWIIRYPYEDDRKFRNKRHTDDEVYIVLYIDKEGNKALITRYINYTKVYLINVNGLIKYES